MPKTDKRLSLRFNVTALGERKGEVKIYSAISPWKFGQNDPAVTSDDFDRQLKGLGEVDELTVRINSPGGSVSEAVAIRTVLMKHTATKVIDIEGMCASAATLIACLPGARVRMAKGCDYMIHRSRAGVRGTADDMMSAYNSLMHTDKDMSEIYAERTGKTAEECMELMRAETWYGAEEARENGFVDEIITGTSDGEIVACAYVDEEIVGLMQEFYDRVPEHMIARAIAHEQPAQDPENEVSNESPAVAEASAENNDKGVNHVELREATAEELAQENPELANSIAKEAIMAERERVAEIDDLTPPGAEFAQMAHEAKANGMSAIDFHKQIVARQRAASRAYIDQRQQETRPAASVGGGDSGDNDDDKEAKTEKLAKDLAELAKSMTMDPCYEMAE